MNFKTVLVDDVKSQFARLVKQLRVQHDLTQEELAKALNLSRLTIQNIEKGKNSTMETLLLILQYFGELESWHAFMQSKLESFSDIKSIY